jgi:hypothetical protein
VLEVLVGPLKQQTTQTEMTLLTETFQPLGLWRLPVTGMAGLAAIQLMGQAALVAGVWASFLRQQPLTTPVGERLVHQLEVLVVVEGTGPAAAAAAAHLAQGQPLDVLEEQVEKAAHFKQLQHPVLVVAARQGLPIITAATALTQPPTSTAAPAAVVEATA